MPIYEYRCRNCGHKFQTLVGMIAESPEQACPHCGSLDAERLVSRFSRYRTEDDRLDEIADRLEMMGEPDSPAQARAMAKEVGKALDDDASDEMEEFLDTED